MTLPLEAYGALVWSKFVLLKYLMEAPNNNGVCIVQLPFHIHLLTITH